MLHRFWYTFALRSRVSKNIKLSLGTTQLSRINTGESTQRPCLFGSLRDCFDFLQFVVSVEEACFLRRAGVRNYVREAFFVPSVLPTSTSRVLSTLVRRRFGHGCFSFLDCDCLSTN